MKRICVLGLVLAGLPSVGVTTALGTTAHATPKAARNKPAKPTVLTTKLTCRLKLTTEPPPGSAAVIQGTADGTQFGRVGCDKVLGTGVQADSFSLGSSGTLTGRVQQYFNAGTIHGQYTLVPDDTAPPTTTSFTKASYTGTITIANGRGGYRKATGSGTLKCTTGDLAHYTCTERLELVQTTTA